jgi:hypothetical protein
MDACNTKGIRERKLQEALKKIRDRTKLKKASSKKQKDEKQPDVEMADAEEESKMVIANNNNGD